MEKGNRLPGIVDEERLELRQRQGELAPNPVKDLGGMANHLLHLQRTIGNAAVNRLLRQYAEQRSIQRCAAHGHGGEELEVQRQAARRAPLPVQRAEDDDEENQTA